MIDNVEIKIDKDFSDGGNFPFIVRFVCGAYGAVHLRRNL